MTRARYPAPKAMLLIGRGGAHYRLQKTFRLPVRAPASYDPQDTFRRTPDGEGLSERLSLRKMVSTIKNQRLV